MADQSQEIALDSRVRVPGRSEWVTFHGAVPDGSGKYRVFVAPDGGGPEQVVLSAAEWALIEVLAHDGSGDSERVLAGLWTQWMSAANHNARTSLLAATTLRPFAHQTTAVYGAMLPQPQLRFLLGDEPGTGKTIMAGMTLREMQRLGLVRRGLVVAPAGLVSKWIADFDRFFGGGLRQITASTVHEHALDVDHDLWIVSLELAAMNPNVQDAIRPDKAGWDLVVFDEAHRLTPTAGTFHRVGRLLARSTPRALFMTATPHRGSEWLFRHLLHLVDPDIYPDPGQDKPKDDSELPRLRPGAIHFLRRMKESLVDYDGATRLFKGRRAHNLDIPLSSVEGVIYQQALDMVDEFFPPSAQPLARMVYGKRAASSLHSLRETLLRRRDNMGSNDPVKPSADVDPFDTDVIDSEDEAKVTHADSVASRREKSAINDIVALIDTTFAGGYEPSKWSRLTGDVLGGNGILPGGVEQAVVFTEYADTADWIERRLTDDGYTARVYSGRKTNAERDEIRSAFMRGEYQIIVSTDAGNEGIDLQSAHVLVNYDIPWSLVRLEQRMGRIHRVGQNRDVELYNLIATDTREGDTLLTLLNNFVNAANELDGQLFDSLSLVAELANINYEEWLKAVYGDDQTAKDKALAAARAVKTADLKAKTQQLREEDKQLASTVEARAALTLLQDDLLERVNPAIVTAYLDRLAHAGLITAAPSAQGDGILRLTRTAGLPDSLTGHRNAKTATVAVSGDALTAAAEEVDVTGVIPLGPGEQGFTDLIGLAASQFSPDLYRGGTADDATSITDYDLYAYRATFTESGGRKTTQWASLIRVDATGTALPVRWETLANLTPSSRNDTPHNPLHAHRAEEAASTTATTSEIEQRQVRREWFKKAKQDLATLPFLLTQNITDPAARAREYTRLEEKVNQRLTDLEVLIAVQVSAPELIGHVHVYGAAAPPTIEEKNSEQIAILRVVTLLKSQGWTVDDVQTQGRGFDLLARKGPEQRMVEVKGIWKSATSSGIDLTGREVLIATQHTDDYWLYVIDHCETGTGTIYGIYRNPMSTFRTEITGAVTVTIPGSSLKNATNTEEPPS
ncbi:MAG: helicase-related protein [Candidatus Nanopelagicales bacterium]